MGRNFVCFGTVLFDYVQGLQFERNYFPSWPALLCMPVGTSVTTMAWLLQWTGGCDGFDLNLPHFLQGAPTSKFHIKMDELRPCASGIRNKSTPYHLPELREPASFGSRCVSRLWTCSLGVRISCLGIALLNAYHLNFLHSSRRYS